MHSTACVSMYIKPYTLTWLQPHLHKQGLNYNASTYFFIFICFCLILSILLSYSLLFLPYWLFNSSLVQPLELYAEYMHPSKGGVTMFFVDKLNWQGAFSTSVCKATKKPWQPSMAERWCKYHMVERAVKQAKKDLKKWKV